MKKKVLSTVKNPFNILYWHIALVAALIAAELVFGKVQTYIIVLQAITPILTLVFIFMVNGFVKLDEKAIRLRRFNSSRVERWENLTEVSIVPLTPKRSSFSLMSKKRDFIVLKFDGCKELSDTLYLVNDSAHVIAIMLTKHNRAAIKEFLPERFRGDI